MDAVNLGSLLLAAAAVSALPLRWAFIRISSHGAVDHYYWMLYSNAVREQKRLPAVIEGKYLLEDERQFYPPGFAVLLSLLPKALRQGPESRYLALILDVVTLAILLGFAWAAGLSRDALLAVAIVFGFAPALTTYNTQLTSRGLGNLFLVAGLLAQVMAAQAPTGAAWLWALSLVALAGVIVTHKMTTQFAVVLWPFWTYALAQTGGTEAAWLTGLSPLAALILAVLVTGPAMQRGQWRAHVDIVTFWNRNWRDLGAHQFRQSPIYGDPSEKTPMAYHQDGLKGIARHLILVVGSQPLAVFLPVTLFFSASPPLWIVVWLVVAYVWALATLLINPLKCLGGGHLYLFNAVCPAALWWGFALKNPTPETIALFVLGLTATAFSLSVSYRRRSSRKAVSDDGMDRVIEHLKGLPAGRVAAFPVTAAERIAVETPHAVFWGAHGLGFRTLEPYWPVMRKPLETAFQEYGIDLVVLDTSWWPEGARILSDKCGRGSRTAFGKWCLFETASDLERKSDSGNTQ